MTNEWNPGECENFAAHIENAIDRAFPNGKIDSFTLSTVKGTDAMHTHYTLTDGQRSVAFVPAVRTVRRLPLALKTTTSDARFIGPMPAPIGPRRPLSDVLASDGVDRPVIGPVRRYDYDDRTGADLERAATALLRNAGDLAAWNLAPAPYAAANGEIRTPGLHHIDTVHRYTRQPQVAPDQIARHGVTRWEPPAPMRYRKPEAATIELVDTGTPGTEYTRVRLVSDVVGRGYRFVGHTAQRTTDKPTMTTDRTATRTGKRGPSQGSVWTVDRAAISRRWSKATQEQRDHAQHLAATIRERGSVTVSGVTVELTLAPRERVTIIAGDERLTGGSFPLTEYARRAALA